MTHAQHTPGPWHVGPANIATIDGFKIHRFPVSGNGQAIAAVWNGSVGKEALSFSDGEANAALIARAPDLLAENQRLRAALERLLAECEHDDTIAERGATSAMHQARATLKGRA